MAENLTSDQVKAKYIAVMPKSLGQLYYELQNETAWIHTKWADFRRLYATDQETVDLLNEAAPTFFHNLQRMMWEDILLHLCRITDKRRGTLNIRRVGTLVEIKELKKQFSAKAEEAVEKTEFARDWRNRHLAHRELPPLDGRVPRPLAQATRKKVEVALASIRDSLNLLERYFLDNEVAYEHTIEALGGVESLVARIRVGVEVHRAELAELRSN